MKLIYCPHCEDVRRLFVNINTSCTCGRSYGRYTSIKRAVIGGDVIPVGFDNSTFARALKNRPAEGRGERFQAFVVPHWASTITVEQERY